MKKIQMQTPLVEMDGDEMTRILWKIIKDELLLPYIDLNTEYYDLGLEYRNETDDQVTVDAAEATKKYGVAVKCATITPNKARMEEYTLKKMYKSPNGTIRAILDGTVFRAPIVVKGIEPCVKNWKKPITIARHAYGDVYKNTEMYIDGPGDAYLVFEGADGQQRKELIHHYEGPGVLQGMHNLDDSITSFARCCFNYALDTKQNLWLGGKDTISKIYDGRFKEIFATIYEDEFKEKFEAAGIEYFYSLIDDIVARVMKAEGGFIWACKNYDGDVMSDMVSSAFGSLAMMTSVLVSPQGYYEYEAAHGTVQRHYYRYLKGEETSTNSVATIFAWTGALRKRGELESGRKILEEKQRENQKITEKLQDKKIWLKKVFEQEYQLGYVMELSATEKVTEKEAAKVCSQLAGKFGNDRQSDLLGKLQAEYHKNRGYLLEYQMTLKTLFQDLDEQTSFLEMSMKRIDVSAKYHGTVVKFKELLSILEENERVQSQLLNDKDKELFEIRLPQSHWL